LAFLWELVLPDPSERLVPERRGSSLLLRFAGKLSMIFVGSAFGVLFIALGLYLSGIGQIFSPNGNDPKQNLEFSKNGIEDGPFEESVSTLLVRFCRNGPEFISECRLLKREYCNQPALLAAMRKLVNRHDHPSSALLGQAFLSECDLDEFIGLWTAQALYRTTSFEEAADVINLFPEELTSHPEFASWSGFINEKLGRFDAAALDFHRALYLFPDLSNVALSQYYYVVKNLRSAGRYCEALEPLKLFVGFDPKERMTTQIQQEISSLRTAGQCEDDVAPGSKIIRMKFVNGIFVIDALVNGKTGKFILDTGASTVHLTKEFAVRASVPLVEDRRIQVRGVAGSRLDYFADARHVNVQGFIARNVTVTVASVDRSLDEGIDGLLGQTYLSRFKYGVDGTNLDTSKNLPIPTVS
jgi:aspartyl protease family protein